MSRLPPDGASVVAPAKLTLSLRVLGPRTDGFHEIEALTVMVGAPADSLVVRPAAPGAVDLAVHGGVDVPTGPDNLVVRAARAVISPSDGVAISLTKEIPTGAGLGGGSADAAALLRLARDSFDLDPATVRTVAAALGSDVPVCVEGRPVIMRGRGEQLERVDPVGELWVVIAWPGFAVPTPPVFRAWDELGGPSSDREVPPPDAFAGCVDRLVNDLEPAAEAVDPRVRVFRDGLERVAGAPALLAGSGASCWLAAEDEHHAAALAARVRAELGVEAWSGPVLESVPGMIEG